jgi:ribosomal protein L3 glutamine methyltransferase
MKVIDYIKDVSDRFAGAELFFGHGTKSPRDEAIYLIYSILGIEFSRDPTSLKKELSGEQQQRLERIVIERMLEKTPAAYLVEEAWFAGHKFICDKRALIPRSPIAELVQNRFEPLLKDQPKKILDMCCGGGCIGISCALEFPESYVDMVDISTDCLHLAEENIKLHGLLDRVSVVHSDLFKGLSGTYDLIVTNPPYVSKEELDSLPAEYQHEPITGLLSEAKGLEIPLRILNDAANYMSETGLIIMEVGSTSKLLSDTLKSVPLLWLEFEHGGRGVLALSATELDRIPQLSL